MADFAYIVVMVTVPDRETGLKIARQLVEQKLAACANLLGPMMSLYTWKDAVHEDEEYLLLIKTRRDLFDDRLIPAVRSLHPYELPEIIALPIQMGLPPYMNWINESTR